MRAVWHLRPVLINVFVWVLNMIIHVLWIQHFHHNVWLLLLYLVALCLVHFYLFQLCVFIDFFYARFQFICIAGVLGDYLIGLVALFGLSFEWFMVMRLIRIILNVCLIRILKASWLSLYHAIGALMFLLTFRHTLLLYQLDVIVCCHHLFQPDIGGVLLINNEVLRRLSLVLQDVWMKLFTFHVFSGLGNLLIWHLFCCSACCFKWDLRVLCCWDRILWRVPSIKTIAHLSW